MTVLVAQIATAFKHCGATEFNESGQIPLTSFLNGSFSFPAYRELACNEKGAAIVRGGGFLIAAFTFGILAAASQTSVPAPVRTHSPAAPTADDVSYMYVTLPEPASEPTAAITTPEPRRRPPYSADEAERVRRLHLFDLRPANEGSTHFRAGPRRTIKVD